jgi:hypothetical protein
MFETANYISITGTDCQIICTKICSGDMPLDTISSIKKT